MATVEALQKQLQQEIEKYKGVQKEYQKTLQLRQQLDAQLNENSVVKEELDYLESGASVYKLIGPVLVKQDLDDAKQNVTKRLEYISGEVKRHEKNIKELDKTQESHRENLNELQQQFQQAQVKAAAKT